VGVERERERGERNRMRETEQSEPGADTEIIPQRKYGGGGGSGGGRE
jgi:hypothetical protein